MRNKSLAVLICGSVLLSLPLAPLAQLRGGAVVRMAAAKTTDVSAFLREVVETTPGDADGLYSTETKRIASVLAAPSKKSPIVIEQTGNYRELIMQAVAARMTKLSPGKKFLRSTGPCCFRI